MTLPKLTCPPGYNGCYSFSMDCYTDLSKMINDIIGGIKEYPKCTLLSCDDVKRMRIGYFMEAADGEVFCSWEFYISAKDYKNTVVECSQKYPELKLKWPLTVSSRAILANDIIKYVKAELDESRKCDEDRGGYQFI